MAASMLASKYHRYLTRLENNQGQIAVQNIPGCSRDGLDTDNQGSGDSKEDNIFSEDSSLGESSEVVYQCILLIKQAIAVETSDFLVRRNANIQLFLVVCISSVFLAWTAIGFYMLLTTGNSSLLFADALPGTGFGVVVQRFIFQGGNKLQVDHPSK